MELVFLYQVQNNDKLKKLFKKTKKDDFFSFLNIDKQVFQIKQLMYIFLFV